MCNKKLKVYRTINEVNQEELAKMIDVTLSTYSKKETGKAVFTLEEARKLAEYFNTTIEELFFDLEVNFKNTIKV